MGHILLNSEMKHGCIKSGNLTDVDDHPIR